MIKETIESHEAAWAAEDITLKPEHVLSQISHAKARCQSPVEFRTRHKCPPGSASAHAHGAVAQVYEEYQQQLRASNALDFDDLLMLGAQLFREHPALADHIDHGTSVRLTQSWSTSSKTPMPYSTSLCGSWRPARAA